MRVEKFFSPKELAEIEKAIQEAEARAAGEIVPYVVSHSDHYEAASWKGATLGALLSVLLAAFAYELVEVWGKLSLVWIVLPALLGGSLGYLACAVIRPFKLWLAGPDVIDHHVRQRANAAFLEREVFKTKERTGVLLFLSLLEQRVVILGDSGINAHVHQHEWDEIVSEIISGIRRGNAGAALATAIRQCGTLLAERGVSIGPNDTDELPDNLQMREE